MEGHEEEASAFENLVLALARLQLTAGLIDSVSSEWPPEITGNWEHELETLCSKVYGAIEELQQFAEAYDR